jgi:predicted GIY-YIG superfamily endonuclease
MTVRVYRYPHEAPVRLHPGEQAQRHALYRRHRRYAATGWEHRSGAVEGFTKRYGVRLLVYVECHDTMSQAIQREKQLKKWRRAWKIALIERDNPQWRDLYEDRASL